MAVAVHGVRGRVLMNADILRQRTAWMEPASGREVDWTWRFTFDRRPGDLSLVQARRGGEQCAGVGVAGVGEQRVAPALLDDAAEVHHGDPVAQVAHDSEVVRYEDHRESQPNPQIFE